MSAFTYGVGEEVSPGSKGTEEQTEESEEGALTVDWRFNLGPEVIVTITTTRLQWITVTVKVSERRHHHGEITIQWENLKT